MNDFREFITQLTDDQLLCESIIRGYELIFESSLTDIYSDAKSIIDSFLVEPQGNLLKSPFNFGKGGIELAFKLSDDLVLMILSDPFDSYKSINGKLVSPSENEFGDGFEIEIMIPKESIPEFLEKKLDYISNTLYPTILHEVVHYLQTKNDPERMLDSRIGRGKKNFPGVSNDKFKDGVYELEEDESLYSRYMNSWHEIQSFVIQLSEEMNIQYPELDQYSKLKMAHENEIYKRFEKYVPSDYLPRINKMILKNLK
jgi:hypothetical protein